MTPHQAACAAAKGTLDLLPEEEPGPVLQWVTPHAILTCCGCDLDEALQLASTLPTTMATALTLAADSYHTTVEAFPDESDEELAAREAVQRGDVADRFRAGDPTVSEACTVTTVHRTGEAELTIQPYTRATTLGGPTILWGEPSYSLTGNVIELQGRVSDSLRYALGAWPLVELGPDRTHETLVAIALSLAEVGLAAEVTPR
jgi:hypothetical protein